MGHLLACLKLSPPPLFLSSIYTSFYIIFSYVSFANILYHLFFVFQNVFMPFHQISYYFLEFAPIIPAIAPTKPVKAKSATSPNPSTKSPTKLEKTINAIKV